jgi:hypothetical protein
MGFSREIFCVMIIFSYILDMPGMGIEPLISLMVVFHVQNFIVATDGGKFESKRNLV